MKKFWEFKEIFLRKFPKNCISDSRNIVENSGKLRWNNYYCLLHSRLSHVSSQNWQEHPIKFLLFEQKQINENQPWNRNGVNECLTILTPSTHFFSLFSKSILENNFENHTWQRGKPLNLWIRRDKISYGLQNSEKTNELQYVDIRFHAQFPNFFVDKIRFSILHLVRDFFFYIDFQFSELVRHRPMGKKNSSKLSKNSEILQDIFWDTSDSFSENNHFRESLGKFGEFPYLFFREFETKFSNVMGSYKEIFY